MFQPELKFSLKKALSYSLLILVIAVSFLFSPQPENDKDYCGQYIHLGAHAGFTFNCDAADYCMNAANPARMLGDSAVRQSRPLFILLASAVGHPMQWLTEKLDLPIFHSMGEEASMYVGYYIGYIIINFLTILLSLFLFESIVLSISGGAINKWILLALQIALVSNEVTKAFFWTAHQQFFSLLTPLLTIWFALRINAQQKTQVNIAGLSLACGVFMLLYGNFLPMFGALVIVAFFTDKKIHLVHLLKNGVLFLLPSILWIAFCIYDHGSYHNTEVDRYRQLVWITDSLHVSGGHFFTVLGDNIQTYFTRFGEMYLFILLALVSCIYIYRQQTIARKTLQSMVITGLMLVFFFMILGYYAERLTYTLLPVCLCIIALAIGNSKKLQKNTAIYLVLVLIWHMYNVLTYGPFS
jgi:hypothetical protein